MALSKADLVSGLREGMQVKSYLNQATMWLGSMVEYIDKNIHEYGGSILQQFKTTSRVGGNEMSLGDLIAWCDYHLVVDVPAAINDQSPRPYFDTIRDKPTGKVYLFRPGDRPIFRWVRNSDEYHFLASSHLVPKWEKMIDADRNLVEFLHNQLTGMAVDKSQIEALGEVPPATTTYTVVAGDTFSGIAAKHGITVDQLKALNPQVKDIGVINIGDQLNVPKLPR